MTDARISMTALVLISAVVSLLTLGLSLFRMSITELSL